MDIYFNKKVVKYMKKKITIEQPVLRLLNIYISFFLLGIVTQTKKIEYTIILARGKFSS